MPKYTAIFLKVDGLEETDIGNPIRLNATAREDAEDEALALPPPDEANFVKLLRDNRYEGPKLGFAL